MNGTDQRAVLPGVADRQAAVGRGDPVDELVDDLRVTGQRFVALFVLHAHLLRRVPQSSRIGGRRSLSSRTVTSHRARLATMSAWWWLPL